MLINHLSLSPSQDTAEPGLEGVRHFIWPQENEKLCPSFSHSHVFYLMPALLLENLRVSVKAFRGGTM